MAVEADRANFGIAGCRERGVWVITGDATDPVVLRRLGRVDKARSLIVVAGADAVNVEVASVAARLARTRSGAPLTAFVNWVNTSVWRVLTLQALVNPQRSSAWSSSTCMSSLYRFCWRSIRHSRPRERMAPGRRCSCWPASTARPASLVAQAVGVAQHGPDGGFPARVSRDWSRCRRPIAVAWRHRERPRCGVVT